MTNIVPITRPCLRLPMTTDMDGDCMVLRRGAETFRVYIDELPTLGVAGAVALTAKSRER